MTQLTPHFSLEEMIASDTAEKNHIVNSPNEGIQENLTRTCEVLERIRSVVGNRAIAISSGYRCPELNRLVGGAATSAHLRGNAADFTVPGMELSDVYNAIRNSDIAYDQLIYENTWIHIGLDATMRGQNLTMYREDGRVLYKPTP